MLVFMVAAGHIKIKASGVKFRSCQFDTLNMGTCTIHTLTESEIEISGASKHFLWVVDLEFYPLTSGSIEAWTDNNAEMHFASLPFDKPDVHVSPGQSNVTVIAWYSFLDKKLVDKAVASTVKS